MKRYSVNAYVQMMRDTLSPCTYLYTFWMTPPPSIPLVTYILNGWLFLNQKTNNDIRTSYSLKYKHSKKELFMNRMK